MKKSFTLMELIVVLVICGILATFAIPTYQSIMDDSKAKVCYTNQLTVLKAVDIYTLEHDSMPASLSMIPAEYVHRAYAQIIPKAGWDIKLAYWLVDREGLDMAYAQTYGTPWLGKYISDLKILKCPLDPYGSATNPSYHINPTTMINYTAFKTLSNTTPVVYETGTWHRKNGANYAIGVSSQGSRLKSFYGGSVSGFYTDTGN